MTIYAIPRGKDFGRPMENVFRPFINHSSTVAMTFHAVKFSRGKDFETPGKNTLAALPPPARLRMSGYEEIISTALICTDAEIAAIAFHAVKFQRGNL